MNDERKALGTTPKAIVFRDTKGIPLKLQGSELLGVKPSIYCSSLLRGAIGISYLFLGDVLGLMCDAYSWSPREINPLSCQW